MGISTSRQNSYKNKLMRFDKKRRNLKITRSITQEC